MPDVTVQLADCVDVKVMLDVLARMKCGDFSTRMPLDWTGLAGPVADGLDDVVIPNQSLELEPLTVLEPWLITVASARQ